MKNKVDFNTALSELTRFSDTYEFNFQFWGSDNNNVFISKGHIDLFDTGGLKTPKLAIVVALQYIYKINKTPEIDRVC